MSLDVALSLFEQPKSKTYTQFIENESSIRQLVIGIFRGKMYIKLISTILICISNFKLMPIEN